MNFEFTKMHGAGNDFIVINGLQLTETLSSNDIVTICDRHRGVGADGIIILNEKASLANIDMLFFNSDGSKANMCGNGLRCAVLYAYQKLNMDKKIEIQTGAGLLSGEVLSSNMVKVHIPVIGEAVEIFIGNELFYFMDTGVPHLIVIKEDILKIDIDKLGRQLRNNDNFTEGTNVDFIQIDYSRRLSPISIRTYERGVEGETLACGTGIVASALCLNKFKKISWPILFCTVDKDILEVTKEYDNVFLTGPAEVAFTGTYKLN